MLQFNDFDSANQALQQGKILPNGKVAVCGRVLRCVDLSAEEYRVALVPTNEMVEDDKNFAPEPE